MSYCKLKTNLETLSPNIPRNFLLSNDLKHMVIYNDTFFVVINLQTKNIVLSNEGHENLRIKYCAIDHDVFIVQYQTASSYLLHIRGLKSALYCHETEVDQEITCHTMADFPVEDNNEILGIFFGTAAGKLKFFSFRGPVQIVDVNLQMDLKLSRPKLKHILIFPEADTRLLVTVDETSVFTFFTFDGGFNCTWTNTFQATQQKNGMLDAFRIGKDVNETLLGYIVRVEEVLVLHTVSPRRFLERLDSVHAIFQRTNLCESDPYIRCSLLRENKYNATQTSKGDVLALIDEGRRNYIYIKLFFFKSGEEVEHHFVPEERLGDSVGTLFIERCGLLLQPHKDGLKRKVNLCVILNKGNNLIFDQLTFPENKQPIERVDLEKYRIFKDNFELTAEGYNYIKSLNIFTGQIEGFDGESDLYQTRLSFLESLLNSPKYQVLVDILLHRVRREGEEEEAFTLLQLEKCEEIVFGIFRRTREETWFEYENIDRLKLNKYVNFLSNVLKVYNAIIKRKREEAVGNLIALNTRSFNSMEDEILSIYTLHKSEVQREEDFCKVLEFAAEFDIGRIYTQYQERIDQAWALKRREHNMVSQDNVEILRNQNQFFIDVVTQGKLAYPAPIGHIFEWIRNSQTYLQKKFLIYYIIKKDFGNLAADIPDLSQNYFDRLNQEFLRKFQLTDLEINQINGLVNIDLLIEKSTLSQGARGELRYKINQEAAAIAKEACYNLSACDLGNSDWKDFILNTFYQYDCHDEMVIFMRSGNFNWSDPVFSRKHVAILVKDQKVVQAYYFVLMQLQLDERDQAINSNYQDLFFYFVHLVISEGLTKQLYNIYFKNHDKLLFQQYFEANPVHSKYYLLYLLKLGQVVEAAEFYMKNLALLEKEEAILRFLVWRIGELPELLRSRIEENYPQLYVKYREISEGSNIREEQGQAMLEETENPSFLDSNISIERSKDLVKMATDKLYISSGKKGKAQYSIDDVFEIIKKKDENERMFGLVFNKPEARNVEANREEQKESTRMELEGQPKKREHSIGSRMEEESKLNASLQRLSLGRQSIGFGGLGQSTSQFRDMMMSGSQRGSKKKLALLF